MSNLRAVTLALVVCSLGTVGCAQDDSSANVVTPLPDGFRGNGIVLSARHIGPEDKPIPVLIFSALEADAARNLIGQVEFDQGAYIKLGRKAVDSMLSMLRSGVIEFIPEPDATRRMFALSAWQSGQGAWKSHVDSNSMKLLLIEAAEDDLRPEQTARIAEVLNRL